MSVISVDYVEGHMTYFSFLCTYFTQVYEFVGLTELYYAGSHGMDIMGPVRPSSSDNRNCIKSIDKQVFTLVIFQS